MQWLRRNDLTEAFEDEAKPRFIAMAEDVVRRRPHVRWRPFSVRTGLSCRQPGTTPRATLRLLTTCTARRLPTPTCTWWTRDSTLCAIPTIPGFRQACDLYNGALEAAMRLAKQDGPLTPGTRRALDTSSSTIQLSIVSKGGWRADQIERIEFASDFQAKGLKNQVHRYGLGVPLILVYRRDLNRPEDQFYAPGMSVAATAFLRVVPQQQDPQSGRIRHSCVIEYHDPLLTHDVQLEDHRLVPLETDLSTPLAYSLSDPLFEDNDVATRGMLNPRDSQSVQGLYLLEPYDPHKVPVLMVHGLWSSLITWMEMFNDLRSDTEIRDHYQFWFYLYATGQPFWTSAAQLRQDLDHARQVLDPRHRAVALDEMVLVGHSMGGLVSKLQTLSSGDAYWRMISDRSLEQLEIPTELRRQMRETWFFEPNPSISRVVTIASPHRGSEFSNGTTQWLARRLIRLPESLSKNTLRLFAQNKDLADSELLKINTSVESLSPNSPVFPMMLRSSHLPKVKYHNIVGVVPHDKVLGRVVARGDGVVKFESASLDDVESEVVVPEDHIKIHRHPRTILEVQRILLEHLAGLRQAYHAQTARQTAGDELQNR